MRPVAEATQRYRAAMTVLHLAAVSLALTLAFAVIVAGQSTSSSFQPIEATIDDVRRGLTTGQITCAQIINAYLRRIDTYNRKGPSLNAVETLNPEGRALAAELDERARQGQPLGALHCIPVLVKDQLETAGMQTAFGSAVFRGFVPNRDATVVSRLKQAGAVIIGKATMGEFAGPMYAGSISGPIRNPYDLTRHAAGSSGGTGAGVAANLATVGIGEDTGGSIRGPAAVNNLVGLRPTLELASRHGLFPARPTSDTVGPLTRTVRDAAILMDVIAGYDPHDPITAASVGRIQGTFVSRLDPHTLRGARFGIITQPMSTRTDPSSADYRRNHAVFDRELDVFRRLGVEWLEPVSIPDLLGHIARGMDANVHETEEAVDQYLAQHPNAPVKSLKEILKTGLVLPSRVNGLASAVGKNRDDVAYLSVRRDIESTRQLIFNIMAAQRLDALIYLSQDHSPIPVADDIMTNPQAEDARRGSNRSLAAMLGFPAIVVPGGFTDEGLPVGIEIMGRPFDDGKLFGYAYAYEQASHHRRPPAATP